jgi:hypothetical protein
LRSPAAAEAFADMRIGDQWRGVAHIEGLSHRHQATKPVRLLLVAAAAG